MGTGCAVARPLDVIGDSWSLLIVRDAFDGLRRFGEFQKSLGLAKNILSARLRSLVDHGVLEAVPASDGSAYQEYVLTEKGRGLFPFSWPCANGARTFSSNPVKTTCSWSTASAASPSVDWSFDRRTAGCYARKIRR